MMKIELMESIVLSLPYGDEGNFENMLHLPNYHRNASFVEIRLEDGTSGMGEGYLGVFNEMIDLYKLYLIGSGVSKMDDTIEELENVSGYWFFSGAARHVISIIDIAIWDINEKKAALLLHVFMNPNSGKKAIQLYGSGGDSISPHYMGKEFDILNDLGIKIF